MILVVSFLLTTTLCAKPRARELGIPLDGEPGPMNAITDVAGVEVGQVSVLAGRGVKGEHHTARTGVTVIFPRGKKLMSGIPGGWTTLNGNGEVTGTSWLQESGLLEGPIALTNTHSVGLVRDSIVDWVHQKFPNNFDDALLPVVGETDDSWLNDLYSFHVRKKHVFEAINKANSGPVEEGAVGAGTGTVTFGFKAGIGTSSRVTEGDYTVGVLVQSNFGRREDFKVAGIPVGKILAKEYVGIDNPRSRRDGSIVVIVATDAPLLPHQVQRMVKRVSLGLARTGALGRNTSGDFFIGFSTSAPKEMNKSTQVWVGLKNEALDPIFQAAVQSTEEAILNAIVGAKDVKGINGSQYFALPGERLKKILQESIVDKMPKAAFRK